MIRKYKKLPVVIRAVQYKQLNKEILAFCPCIIGDEDHYFIDTLEGDMELSVGDYIIKGVEGEFYPCKESIFNKTYEEVE